MALKLSFFDEALSINGRLRNNWKDSATNTESKLHQLSPYIGKVKSSIAAALVAEFSDKGDIIYDPFAGSGTIPLEAWKAGRAAIANDWNPYASLLTEAKLFPYVSTEDALTDIESVSVEARNAALKVDLRAIPTWVRAFFHPETLRDVAGWASILRRQQLSFLLACLLGILHHQRPGFLSYPSSHTVPYLRSKKFPRNRFPRLYEYRSVRDRLEAKVKRALKSLPPLDFRIHRSCSSCNALQLVLRQKVDAIITSPPYMWQLDYGRDNRLRLWFLGCHSWKEIDNRVTPSEKDFLRLMRRCLTLWSSALSEKGRIVLVLGDSRCKETGKRLPDTVANLATSELGLYSTVYRYTDPIPNVRRVRRECRGNISETVLVLKKK